jgi:uncharacterized membrane protein
VLLASYGSGLYKVLFLGHMISFLVAFAPAVVHPILAAQTKGEGDDAAFRRQLAHQAANGRLIHFPAVIAMGAFGIGLVLVSDPVWAFDQAWVSLAFLVWIAICGVVSGLLLPAERRAAAGEVAAERLVGRGDQITTVLTLVMLYLMIWKPGA